MSDVIDDDNGDRPIGYKRPPVHTRFRPGKSGNPKGRPKKSRNFKTDLAEEMSERVLIKEGGRVKKVSKQRAMIKSISAKAMGGSIPAFFSIANLIYRYLQVEEADSAEVADLSETDQAILDAFRKRTEADLHRKGKRKPKRKAKRKPKPKLARESDDE